jgi:dolichol-phosphate mannosyltransferase
LQDFTSVTNAEGSAERLQPGPDLSVIVPTFNEKSNVNELVRRLEDCLHDVSWEVIFVDDDSPDGTAEEARSLARRDSRVRCLQRIGRRGLSTACIEGMLASSAPYVAVIDGDLQHDETVLPRMLEVLRQGDCDIAVGSRYVQGGGIGSWKRSRATASRMATNLSRFVIRVELSDPMSGFFMLRREVLEASVRKLSGLGFKILVDLFASSPRPLRFVDLPYTFRERSQGESKFDLQAAWSFGLLLLDKKLSRFVPVRFLSFAAIGGFGILLHLLVQAIFFTQLRLPFEASQAAGTIAAMTSNFQLNNMLTYSDRRLSGWRWVRGYLLFVLACSLGAVANVGVAAYFYDAGSGWLLPAMAGILVGAGWNYAATREYVWGRRGA